MIVNRLNYRSSHSQPQSSSSMELRRKLAHIIYRHRQVQNAFNQLKSQIKTGLTEAEDVFASLAIPLVKLVGLKTEEMADEGRFNTILTKHDSNSQDSRMNDLEMEMEVKSHSASSGKEKSYQEICYGTQASIIAEDLRNRQKLQLTRLIYILKGIETQVNSSQNDILQTLADNRDSILRFFQKAFTFIAAVCQSDQTHSTLPVTVKILQDACKRIGEVLSSVEEGVEDMIHELAKHLCTPMIEYVKCLKAELAAEPILQLLAIVDQMELAMIDGKLELNESRKTRRLAEERSVEAFTRLKKSEEKIVKMKEFLGFLLESRKGSMDHVLGKQELVGGDQYQGKDEKIMYEVLKKKRKNSVSVSPLGPGQLQCIGFHNHLNDPRRKSTAIAGKWLNIRNPSRVTTPHTTNLDLRLPLGSSPSLVNLSCKRLKKG
ncbi:uncharacterized protein LOC124913398 [Impatiens glandulifera]|uniref:uncharacterized protein LOC124913398 n=1 Tax=Impatiens glandulifera TaxID=253017 RepID=UPI001FB10832|nr:uncharacterized protein LOC124913398 [Impatiens glandulifera]